MKISRDQLRKNGIKGRDSLDAETREAYSKRICKEVMSTPWFEEAKVIMIYNAVRGEVNLADLETEAKAHGKRIAYPLCINSEEMIAMEPETENDWAIGAFGIREPRLEASLVVMPEEIDFVVCPCTVFDEECNRMGMGAGYYDRFIPLCKKASVVAVAFEAQKAEKVPAEKWDMVMQAVITEEKTYFKQ